MVDHMLESCFPLPLSSLVFCLNMPTFTVLEFVISRIVCLLCFMDPFSKLLSCKLFSEHFINISACTKINLKLSVLCRQTLKRDISGKKGKKGFVVRSSRLTRVRS